MDKRKGTKQEVLILDKAPWIKFWLTIAANPCGWSFLQVQETSAVTKRLLLLLLFWNIQDFFWGEF